MGDWVIDIVKRSDEDAAKSFVLLPRRWVVERPIGLSTIACAHMCSAPCGLGIGAFGSTLNLRSSVQCCTILGFYRRTRPRILLSRSIALMPPSSSRGAGIGATAEHLIWNAIAMQDRWALASKQEPELVVVSPGACGDAFGVDDDAVRPPALRDILHALPRQEFKARLAELLTAPCHRKPMSQVGTRRDRYCRTTNPQLKYLSVADAIARVPFSE